MYVAYDIDDPIWIMMAILVIIHEIPSQTIRNWDNSAQVCFPDKLDNSKHLAILYQ